MSSPGGALDDALSLYGFLRTLPIKLTTVNMGTIASITIAPFLAGTHGICCPHGIFHFHDFEWNYPAPHAMTRPQYADPTQLLNVSRDKTFEFLKLHTFLTDADFKALQLLDQPVIKDAVFAKAFPMAIALIP
jgi:ATP-dependent protease ClpP protease subunit